MNVTNIYNTIYRTLVTDQILLNIMGIKRYIDEYEIPESDSDFYTRLSKSFKKRRNPQDILETLPVIAFYTPDGMNDRNNSSVYNAIFVFDIYTQDNVEMAHNISNRLYDIFDSKIPNAQGVTTFETLFEAGHEVPTDLMNTYCFRNIYTFSVCYEDC